MNDNVVPFPQKDGFDRTAPLHTKTILAICMKRLDFERGNFSDEAFLPYGLIDAEIHAAIDTFVRIWKYDLVPRIAFSGMSELFGTFNGIRVGISARSTDKYIVTLTDFAGRNAVFFCNSKTSLADLLYSDGNIDQLGETVNFLRKGFLDSSLNSATAETFG